MIKKNPVKYVSLPSTHWGAPAWSATSSASLENLAPFMSQLTEGWDKKNNPWLIWRTVSCLSFYKVTRHSVAWYRRETKGVDETRARQPPFCCHDDSSRFQFLCE